MVITEHNKHLFAAAARGIDACGLSIQDARLYSGKDIAIGIFAVLDEHAHAISDDPTRVDRLKTAVTKALSASEGQPSSSTRTRRQLKQFPVSTRAHIDYREPYNLLEVSTADRPGLLALIAELFIEHDIYLQNARITTLGERVEDLFFISDNQHQPLRDTAKCDALVATICDAIDQKVDSNKNFVSANREFTS